MKKRKKDSSKALYEFYYSKPDRVVKITLRNGTTLTGRISGFYHGSDTDDPPFISKWHVCPTDSEPENPEAGDILNHSDIQSVQCIDDGSEIIL